MLGRSEVNLSVEAAVGRLRPLRSLETPGDFLRQLPKWFIQQISSVRKWLQTSGEGRTLTHRKIDDLIQGRAPALGF